MSTRQRSRVESHDTVRQYVIMDYTGKEWEIIQEYSSNILHLKLLANDDDGGGGGDDDDDDDDGDDDEDEVRK